MRRLFWCGRATTERCALGRLRRIEFQEVEATAFGGCVGGGIRLRPVLDELLMFIIG